MSSQDSFRAGLLDPKVPVPEGLVDGQGRRATKRYGVYRNNVTHSLIEALKTAFPLVRGLLGPEAFDALAPQYVRAHPPTSPLMMFYGAEFPEFLASQEQFSRIGYLPDAARLDQAMRHSYHAADAPRFDPAVLQSLSTEALMQARLTLAPASQIIRSAWPLYDIWRFSTQTDAPKPQARAQDVLIARPDFDPAPHLLPAGGALWLDLMAEGQTFGAAVDATTEGLPSFDLTACLTVLLQSGALAEISTKELT